MLETPLEQLAFIIAKARGFGAEIMPSDTEDGSNPADDRDVAILEDTPDNPTEAELADAIGLLNEDQKAELLALVLIGRGDFDAGDWRSAQAQARDALGSDTIGELVATPLLADYLEEGLAELGYSIEDFEKNQM